MGKVKCEVCGFEFTPLKADHYVARGECVEGSISRIVSSNREPELYDAWDCPVCGAQYAVDGRKRRVDPLVIEIEEECEEEENGDE